jgi:hypothetical protein
MAVTGLGTRQYKGGKCQRNESNGKQTIGNAHGDLLEFELLTDHEGEPVTFLLRGTFAPQYFGAIAFEPLFNLGRIGIARGVTDTATGSMVLPVSARPAPRVSLP